MGTLLSEDHLSYSYRDLLRKYVDGGMTDSSRKDWRYRYSAGGQREQKRMYFNQGPDTSGRIHPWVYYLLGAGDEQLAIYHGQQMRDSLCGEGGRRVYIYPAEYHTRGPDDLTNIITRPDGERLYVITDHLGSERSVYSSLGYLWDQTDYDPFGRPQSVGTPHNSYIDRERDAESSLMDFGVRKYDPITGRFVSTDALMLEYPEDSPYGYAANNPLVLLDPSGLEWVRIANPLNSGEYEWQEVNAVGRAAGFMGSGPQGFAGTIDVSGLASRPATASMPDVTQLPEIRQKPPRRDREWKPAWADWGGRAGGAGKGPDYSGGSGSRRGSRGTGSGGAAGSGRKAGGGFTELPAGDGQAGGGAGGVRPQISSGLANRISAPFKSGDIIVRELTTSKGAVEMAAEVRISGSNLHLKDIAVYPKGAGSLQVGSAEVMAMRNQLAIEAKSMGFQQLRITGTRLTGAKPGKTVDITIDLTK